MPLWCVQCYYSGKMLANQNMEALHLRELYVYMTFRLKNTNLNIMPCSWKTKAASLKCFSCKPHKHMFLFIWNTLDSATHSLSDGQILQLYARTYQLFLIWNTWAFVFTHLTFLVCIPSPQWREFCSPLILHGDHGPTSQEYWLHSL